MTAVPPHLEDLRAALPTGFPTQRFPIIGKNGTGKFQ
jgi:hypothetical protein